MYTHLAVYPGIEVLAKFDSHTYNFKVQLDDDRIEIQKQSDTPRNLYILNEYITSFASDPGISQLLTFNISELILEIQYFCILLDLYSNWTHTEVS